MKATSGQRLRGMFVAVSRPDQTCDDIVVSVISGERCQHWRRVPVRVYRKREFTKGLNVNQMMRIPGSPKSFLSRPSLTAALAAILATLAANHGAATTYFAGDQCLMTDASAGMEVLAFHDGSGTIQNRSIGFVRDLRLPSCKRSLQPLHHRWNESNELLSALHESI